MWSVENEQELRMQTRLRLVEWLSLVKKNRDFEILWRDQKQKGQNAFNVSG